MIRSKWWCGLPATLATLLASAACDAQVEPGYAGDVLISLSGTASSAEPLPSGDIEAQLRWVNFLASKQEVGLLSRASGLASQGEFPARFEIEVFTFPWDGWLNDFTGGGASPHESRIGLAELRADGGDGDWFRDAGWGAYSRQVLVYVDRDIEPGTVSERFAGGTLSAGFHVLDVVDAPCESYLPADDPAGPTLDCLQPAPDDLDADLDLRFYRVTEEAPDVPPEVPHLFE